MEHGLKAADGVEGIKRHCFTFARYSPSFPNVLQGTFSLCFILGYVHSTPVTDHLRHAGTVLGTRSIAASQTQCRCCHRHIKRWSASSASRKMQIKTTVRCHCPATRVAVIRRRVTASVGKNMRRREPSDCWWQCQIGAAAQIILWEVLKRLAVELPYDPTIPLRRIYLRERKTLCKNMRTNIHSNRIHNHNSQKIETAPMSSSA